MGEAEGETQIREEVNTEKVSVDNEITDERAVEKGKSPIPPPVKPYVPPIPFPQRLRQTKLDKEFEKFL